MGAKKPLWMQILSTEGKQIFGLTTGPSIPFVVGVYYHYNQLSDEYLETDICLQKIFSEILGQNHCMAGVTICPGLGVHVLRNAMSECHNPITEANCDSMIEKLWGEYGRFITERRFSIDKVDHHWRAFDENEIEKIKQLKK